MIYQGGNTYRMEDVSESTNLKKLYANLFSLFSITEDTVALYLAEEHSKNPIISASAS